MDPIRKKSGFIKEMEFVYYAVRTNCLNIVRVHFLLIYLNFHLVVVDGASETS
jgi:hypothetical protein